MPHSIRRRQRRRQIHGNVRILPAAVAACREPAEVNGVHSAGLGDSVARQEPSMGVPASPGPGPELGKHSVTGDGEEFCVESGREQ